MLHSSLTADCTSILERKSFSQRHWEANRFAYFLGWRDGLPHHAARNMIAYQPAQLTSWPPASGRVASRSHGPTAVVITSSDSLLTSLSINKRSDPKSPGTTRVVLISCQSLVGVINTCLQSFKKTVCGVYFDLNHSQGGFRVTIVEFVYSWAFFINVFSNKNHVNSNVNVLNMLM